ncbi:MAG: hypothetical protein QOF14_5111 [Hyphomicrobiales bacterium]|jgi:uncharacterized protein (DUF4415 family)|nr:hypothetical protein [Hyphomicrobiales bacterium]
MRKAEVRAVLIDGKAYEKKRDGSLVPLKGRTNWAKVARMTDADIEAQTRGADDAPMTDEEWARAPLVRPDKVAVGLRLDNDVLRWFKARGKGYQTRINAVLRRYIEAQRKAG